MPRSKEQIYDEDIAPLMDQVLRICKQHDITYVGSFHTPSHTDVDICVSSAIGRGRAAVPQFMRLMYSAQQHGVRNSTMISDRAHMQKPLN